MARLHNYAIKNTFLHAMHILISEKEIVSITQQMKNNNNNNKIFHVKTYGELYIVHNLSLIWLLYHRSVITTFYKVAMFLFLAQFCSNFHRYIH